MNTLITIVGYFGSFIIAAQYVLMMMNKINPKSFQYYLYNTFGSIFLLLSLWYHMNYPSLGIEIFWLVVSLFGVVKYYSSKTYRVN